VRVKFLIIGAGPAGLGAAYRLKELQETDYLVLERNSWVGGLATSFQDEKGFVWDIGGHVQFSHYPYFDEVMSKALAKEDWLHHERESWVWIKDRFVPYPFQNNIRYLPKEAMWKCLKGLVELSYNHDTKKPANFEEWILKSFGEGIAEEFMLPYNYKVWAYKPEKMSYQWIGERVATIDLARILENIIFERDDVSWGPNNTFQFPRKGGTGAIWKSVGEMVGKEKIKLESEVKEVVSSDKYVILADGQKVYYEKLLSTMPLDILPSLVREIPDSVKKKASGLKHSSSNIIGIGIKGKPSPELATKCWMYFPEDNCPFYRVTVFSNYSPNNVPDISSQFSLMAEVSESVDKKVNLENLLQDTIEGLRKTKLLQPEHEIVSTWTYRANYGYPTPSLERDKIMAEVVPVLHKLELYPRGRFGAWLYEASNQDHTFMQGVEWVNFITTGDKETTFQVP